MASTSIWEQMSYVPPRGACNHKESLLSGKCSCLRFMIHPLKATTSFDCDGCNHHASFHSMENPQEAEVIKRWQAAEQERQDARTGAATKKRPRHAIEDAGPSGRVSFIEEAAGLYSRPAGKKKAKNSEPRITELIQVDKEVVYL